MIFFKKKSDMLPMALLRLYGSFAGIGMSGISLSVFCGVSGYIFRYPHNPLKQWLEQVLQLFF